jgi:hypothetical protein
MGCYETLKPADNQYSVAIKSVTEFLDGEKFHYREFDAKENELLHIYYNDEVEEKTICKYDTSGLLLVELEFQNDSLIRKVKYKYEFDSQHRPLKITAKVGSIENSGIFRYIEKKDTLVTITISLKKIFEKNNWLSKSFTDKNEKLYWIEYNEIYGGGGEKIINHFTENGLIDYQVHFYLGYDTTYYHYNENNKIVRIESKSRGREEYNDFEYDVDGNRTKMIITEIVYYHGDTLISEWTYKWNEIEKK